jgi:hypothetical protein
MPRKFANIASSIGKTLKEGRREQQPLPERLSALLSTLAERENQSSRVRTKEKPRTLRARLLRKLGRTR